MGRLFGTDGVRGIANKDLTCERVMEIGRATAIILSEGCHQAPTFVIGCDTRASSDMIKSAVSAGICSVGANVIDLGVVSTPAVAYLVVKYKANAGIMISASHNPSEFNGIKIFNGNGYKLDDMLEERIEEIVLDNTEELKNSNITKMGRIFHSKDAVTDYIRHIKSLMDNSLHGMKIAIDCANGSAYVSAKKLFSELGAEVHIIFDEPDGYNINRDCGSTNLNALKEYVIEKKLDCGVAFDGDADRCLCVDENGDVIDGDIIMAICSLDLLKRGKLNNNAVVGTIMTNFGFSKFCDDNGLRLISTKVGDRYVLEKMLLEDYSFGGEQSGHIIFRDFATTGDGQLTAAMLLSHMNAEGKTLSELSKVITKYPQVSVNISTTAEGKIAFFTDKIIEEIISIKKKDLDKTGRIVVRPSGTENLIRVMIEGKDYNIIKTMANDVANIIRERVGSE